MRMKLVAKWLLVAAALVMAVQAADAGVACRCGAETQEYQILKSDQGTVVRVWLVNYCRFPAYFLVNVVAKAADDGALLRSDRPVRLNPWQRMPVDVVFKEDISTVSYWFATRLGSTVPI